MMHFHRSTFAHVRWDFLLKGKPCYVLLTADVIGYTRRIEFNDRVVLHDKVSHTGGWKYEFAHGTHSLCVVLDSAFWSFSRYGALAKRCHLYVDGAEVG